jgi:hypothetical protein
MSTAAVSANSIYQELQSFYQQRRSDLQQLGKDLKSGDLTDAQQEYQALQTLGQSGPFANGDTFALSGRKHDFKNIGTALQSGDITAAEQALQQLGQSFKHPASAAASTTSPIASDASTSAAASASSAGGPEIVLNLANMPAGEQITIGLSSGANGSEQVSISAENAQGQSDGQIMLNLSRNTNEQIVLNLFNSSATTSTQGSAVNVSA